MNAMLRCDNCDCDLRVSYDSWDDEPRLPRVLRFYPCKCVTDRLETVLKVVNTCHGFIDRSVDHDTSVKDWIEAKLAKILELRKRVAALEQQVVQQNDMLGGNY